MASPAPGKRGDATLELPNLDVPGGTVAATSGAKSIFFRFVFVVVSINAAFGVALVFFDVNDSLRQADEALSEAGKNVVGICGRLEVLHPDLAPSRWVEQCSTLTGVPMLLLDKKRQTLHQTDPRLAELLPKIYDGAKEPFHGMTVKIDNALGRLSGAWFATSVGDRLLVFVVHRSPEDLGYFEYMTVGAGILILGLALSFAVMVASARWVLYQPVQRLVDKLTGALARDIERRRLAEQKAIGARLEAEEHLNFRNNLLDAAETVGIIGTDAVGVIRIYNRAAEQILGYADDEVRDTLTLEVLRARSHHKAETELPLRSMMQLAEGQEFRVDKQGREHLLTINRAEILDSSGEHAGQLVTFVDISEQKRLEAELQLNEMQLIQSAKMASLGEMATGIAHEVNQPLNNIGLLTSRVLRRLSRIDNEEERRFISEKLKRVQGQVERAGRIIEQLRTFGRRSSETKLLSFDLRPPIAHVEDMLGEQLRQAGIELQVDLPEDLPPALGDAGQLEQVLLNMLINARDAFEDGAKLPEWSPPDKPCITVTARTLTDPAGIELKVNDNGPGMPADVRARVFQPFYTTKEVGRGTGLGLAISYSLIRGSGGTLGVESELGRGTIFTISLRRVATPPASKADEHEGQDTPS